MTTIKSLQGMYVKLGGSLTDTYSDIADGTPVGQLTTIPEMIQACTKKATSGGGGGGDTPELFWINATVGGEGIELDKTYAEITAAVEDGMLPIIDVMSTIEIPMVGKPSELPGYDKFCFAAVAQIDPSEEPNIIAWALSSDDTVSEVGELFATKTYVDTQIPLAVAPFVVTFTVNADLTAVTAVDKTYAEVAAAYSDGKTIIGKAVISGQTDELATFDLTQKVYAQEVAGYAYQFEVLGSTNVIKVISLLPESAVIIADHLDFDPFHVTFTDNSGTITANKQFADVLAVIDADKIVVAKDSFGLLTGGIYNSGLINFYRLELDNGDVKYINYAFASDESVTKTTKNITST